MEAEGAVVSCWHMYEVGVRCFQLTGDHAGRKNDEGVSASTHVNKLGAIGWIWSKNG